MPGGLAVISVGLLAASAAPALVMRRRYGRRAGARFAAGSMLAMLAQQSLVGVAASRTNASLSAVDAMTLSRGVASAVLVGLLVSGVRWRDGLAGVHWSTDPSCATGSTDRSRDGSARPASSARCSTWKATPGSLLRPRPQRRRGAGCLVIAWPRLLLAMR